MITLAAIGRSGCSFVLIGALSVLAPAAISAPTVALETAGGSSTTVTIGNFIRAETDAYFKTMEFGKLGHSRTMVSIDEQDVVRMNRDTLYSSGVFDLDAAPVTITLPDPQARFMSMQVISEDHYTIDVAYAPGSYTYSRDKTGTRYVFVLVRTLAKPDPDGSFTIQFGGCRNAVPNCLPIMAGWNYTVRLYRPRNEILDGTWKFPQAHRIPD